MSSNNRIKLTIQIQKCWNRKSICTK